MQIIVRAHMMVQLFTGGWKRKYRGDYATAIIKYSYYYATIFL